MLRINLNLSIRRAALESPGLFRAHTPDVPLPQMVVNLMGVTRGVTAVPSTKSKAVSRPNDPLVSDEASVLCVVADSSSSTLMSLRGESRSLMSMYFGEFWLCPLFSASASPSGTGASAEDDRAA